MPRRGKLPIGAVTCAATIVAIAACSGLSRPARSAEPEISFKEQVLPILDQHCTECHSPSGIAYKAIGLDLRSYQGLRAGSTMGNAVIPYHPELSPLVKVLQGSGHAFKDLKMPPLGPLLSSAEIHTISLWIEQGAKDN